MGGHIHTDTLSHRNRFPSQPSGRHGFRFIPQTDRQDRRTKWSDQRRKEDADDLEEVDNGYVRRAEEEGSV